MLANKLVRAADVTQAKAAHFGAEVVNLNELKIPEGTVRVYRKRAMDKIRLELERSAEMPLCVPFRTPTSVGLRSRGALTFDITFGSLSSMSTPMADDPMSIEPLLRRTVPAASRST